MLSTVSFVPAYALNRWLGLCLEDRHFGNIVDITETDGIRDTPGLLTRTSTASESSTRSSMRRQSTSRSSILSKTETSI